MLILHSRSYLERFFTPTQMRSHLHFMTLDLRPVLYKITYFATFGGYGLALLDFLGLGVLIQVTFHPQTDPHPLMTIGLIAMFYGQ